MNIILIIKKSNFYKPMIQTKKYYFNLKKINMNISSEKLKLPLAGWKLMQ